MFTSTTRIEVDPVIEAGSSAADAIGQALDRAQDQTQVDQILTREIPYVTTLKRFDRLGRIQCRRPAGEHIDQPPVSVTINETIVTQITNSVSTTLGASLTATVQAGLKAAIPGGSEASVSSSLSGTVEASKTVVSAVQTQLSRSVGVTETLPVTFHAAPCFEHDNPYGLCLEITVRGRIGFKQNATISRGSDGLFHYMLVNSGRITAMTIDEVDVSLDPCIKPDESPTRIAGCVPPKRLGSRLPVEGIDGIGKSLGSALRDQGIHTVGDLALADPALQLAGIPRRTLQQLRAKALMVVAALPDIEALAPLADRSVVEILEQTPESLGSALGGRLDPAGIRRVQDDLAALLVSLDNGLVERSTLAELAG